MAKQLSEFLLDKRIVERNLKKGLLTEKDLSDHLTKLPDVAGQAEVIEVATPAEAEGEG